MGYQDKNPSDDPLKFHRGAKQDKMKRLSNYLNDYTTDAFIKDLFLYFDNEIDFNLEKIRKAIDKPGKLEQLKIRAKENNTHPVTEFVQELFKELGQSGDVGWSGEL